MAIRLPPAIGGIRPNPHQVSVNRFRDPLPLSRAVSSPHHLDYSALTLQASSLITFFRALPPPMTPLRHIRRASVVLARTVVYITAAILILVGIALAIAETGWAKNEIRQLIVRQA